MASHAVNAERLALALLRGQVPAEMRAGAFADLATFNRGAQVERDARALADYRAGRPVWAWPAVAPWAGFGEALSCPLDSGQASPILVSKQPTEGRHTR
jgi:hypothetical protein